MKKAWILIMTIAMVGLFNIKSNAQLSLGINGGICLPQNSDFSNGFSSGFGGSVNAEFNIAKIGIGLNAGDYFFKGKDNSTVSSATFSAIPIILDVKYYFFPIIFKPFIGIGGGMYNEHLKETITVLGTSSSSSASESHFGFAPEIGFALGLHTKLCVSAKYNIVPKGSGNFGNVDYLSLNLGLIFPLI
jgi:opacity protein-like surface antigen